MNFSLTIAIGIVFFAGLYIVLPPALTWFFQNIDFGNKIYLKIIQNYAKEGFENATKQQNPDRAWTEIAYKKIHEIGNSKCSYAKRRNNLAYIKSTFSSMPVTRKALDSLVSVLPVQKDKEFLSELACYICDIANNLKNENSHNHHNTTSSKQIEQSIVKKFTTAISILSPSILILFLTWKFLDVYPMLDVLVMSFTIFIVSIIPIFSFIRGGSKQIQAIIISAIIMLLWLSSFSWINHRAILTEPKVVQLDNYGYSDTSITVRYPTWLTADDISDCDDKKNVSILMDGENVPLISFNPDTVKLLDTKDKECSFCLEPTIDENTPKEKAFEFYYVPLSQAELSENQTVTIIPVIHEGVKDIPIIELQTEINIENRMWTMLKNVFLAISTSSVLLQIAFTFLTGRSSN